MARKLRNSLDSAARGLLVFIWVPIWMSMPLIVIAGYLYGPLVFLSIMGAILGLISFYVERTVGKSIQFGEYRFWRKVLAQVIAFVVLASVLYFFLYLG